MVNVIELDEVNFDQEVKRSTIPVLVDFWAPWCGHCRNQLPIIDALAKEYADKIRFAKLNIDEAPSKAEEYDIRGIPALMIFKDSKIVHQFSGFQEKQQLKNVLIKYI